MTAPPQPDPPAGGQWPAPPPPPTAATAPAADGTTADRVRCPHCGSTETPWLPDKGVMKCDVCRSTFAVDASGAAHLVNDDIAGLTGVELSQGARHDVAPESDDAVHTYRCPTCHADLVVEAGTNEATVKCHWCRNRITTADRIANGARPDGIVPFALTREQARDRMEAFLGKRRTFASKKFLAEYSLENIQPVYFPYFVVDVNAHSAHAGQAGRRIRRYTVGADEHKRTVYDYDVYAFQREFNLYVNDLLIENNLEFARIDTQVNTHNIINSIAPWDTHAQVPYDPRYLQGEYRAERRTGNIDQIRPQILAQVADISRYQANRTLDWYDHGIRYEADQVDIAGERWLTTLCPAWIYSYLDTRGDRPLLHYIAVNGATGETMGSVPVNKARMLAVSAIVEAAALVAAAAVLLLTI
jgi:DNA-directed RNA polymerase subunit RPC12/RpoP